MGFESLKRVQYDCLKNQNTIVLKIRFFPGGLLLFNDNSTIFSCIMATNLVGMS